MSEKPDYEVGYGKPPKATQFRPGKSGNPKGRPKGRKSAITILEDLFLKKITIREGGKPRKVARLEAMCLRVLNDSAKGDARATDQVLKLITLMQSTSGKEEGAAIAEPSDLAEDLETITRFLELYDLPTDGLREEQGDE